MSVAEEDSEYSEDDLSEETQYGVQAESEKWKIVSKHLNTDGTNGELLHRNTVFKNAEDAEVHAFGYMIGSILDNAIAGKPPPENFGSNYLMMRERLLISTEDGRGRHDIVRIMQGMAMAEDEERRRSIIDTILGPKRGKE